MTQRTLTESSSTLAPKADGVYKVVLITPGRGSSGFYSEEMLRETGPSAFPKNTHSYMNHLAEGEHRSPEKLIMVTQEDAYYEDGVGLVADAKVMKHWRDFVEEVAPHVGMSISAEGVGEQREMDGEEVFVVEALLPNVTNSVDLVSYAGRGGYIAEQLKEQALKKSTHSESSAGTDKKEDERMAFDEKVVSDLVVEVQKLVSAQEASAASKLDEDALNQKVAEAVKSAVEATRKVAEAELTEKQSERLYAQIEGLDFDVDGKLTEFAEIRDEVKESLTESLAESRFSFGLSAGSDNQPESIAKYKIGAWS